MTGAADKGRGMGLAADSSRVLIYSATSARRACVRVLLVAGVDEAGRGPLAGPVVAAR